MRVPPCILPQKNHPAVGCLVAASLTPQTAVLAVLCNYEGRLSRRWDFVPLDSSHCSMEQRRSVIEKATFIVVERTSGNCNQGLLLT